MSDRITLSFPNRFLGGKTKHPVSNIQDTTGSTKSHLLNRAVNFLTSTNLFSSLTDIFSSCLSHVQASLSLPISLSSLSSFSKILLTFLYLNGRERERSLVTGLLSKCVHPPGTQNSSHPQGWQGPSHYPQSPRVHISRNPELEMELRLKNRNSSTGCRYPIWQLTQKPTQSIFSFYLSP